WAAPPGVLQWSAHSAAGEVPPPTGCLGTSPPKRPPIPVPHPESRFPGRTQLRSCYPQDQKVSLLLSLPRGRARVEKSRGMPQRGSIPLASIQRDGLRRAAPLPPPSAAVGGLRGRPQIP